MKKSIDYKVKDGKLLRLDINIEGKKIKKIKITGDFFVYPEEGIEDIENILCGKRIKEVEEVLKKIQKEKKIKFIGFSMKDLVFAIKSSV